jgi:hypothetical protein
MLHPPSPKSGEYAGYPDNNATPSLQYEFRLTDDVTPLLNTTQIKGEDVGALILFAPGFLIPTFQAYLTADINLWMSAPSTSGGGGGNLGQRNINFIKDWPVTQGEIDRLADISATRQTFRSSTVYLNTNELTNKGTMSAASFRPNVFIISVGGSGRLGVEHVTKQGNTSPLSSSFLERCVNFDAFKDKLTKFHNERNDLARMINDTRASSRTDKDNILPPPTPYIISDTVIQVVVLGDHINAMSQIGQMSPKSDTWLAKEGAYWRSFPAQPVNMYKATEFSVASSRVQNLLYCAYASINATGQWNINYFTNGSTDPNDPRTALQDLPWSDWTWGYVWMNDLDKASSVTIKTIQGFEVQPVVGSMLSPLISIPAPPDNMALESLSIITNKAPDVLPASFNDDGPTKSAAQTKEELTPAETSELVGMSNEVSQTQSKPLQKTNKSRGWPSIPKEAKGGRPARQTEHKQANHKSTNKKKGTGTPSGGNGTIRVRGPNGQHGNKPPQVPLTKAKSANNKVGKQLSKMMKKVKV